MNLKPVFLLLPMAVFSIVGSSCSSTKNTISPLAAYQSYDRPASLPANPDKVSVKVSLKKQRAYVMEKDRLLLAMPVSIGAPETPTPSGNFHIYQKIHKKRSATHGFAHRGDQVKRSSLADKPFGWSFTGNPLPYWCEFKPGYAFHTGWVRHHPSTDGCIRMHENLAPKFFRLVKTGTPVNISYTQEEDALFKTMPLPPDAGPLPDYPSASYLGSKPFTRHKLPEFILPPS